MPARSVTDAVGTKTPYVAAPIKEFLKVKVSVWRLIVTLTSNGVSLLAGLLTGPRSTFPPRPRFIILIDENAVPLEMSSLKMTEALIKSVFTVESWRGLFIRTSGAFVSAGGTPDTKALLRLKLFELGF